MSGFNAVLSESYTNVIIVKLNPTSEMYTFHYIYTVAVVQSLKSNEEL